jgi:holo-[acyl-carrier protein] synthase
MIAGVGTDLVEVLRIRQSVERFGDRFLNRIYTEVERNYCLSKANQFERLAARFAAKEAGMKALGTGWNCGVSWQDFQVVNALSGRPTLRLAGTAAKIADKAGVRHISLSMTHTATEGFAIVIFETTEVSTGGI